MTQAIRLAEPNDIPRLVELLLLDAAERQAADPLLWKLAEDAPKQIEKALTFTLTAEQQPFQQFWHVSENAARVTGVIHSMLLPVPPIYAGSQGDPGLILPDSYVARNAPDGTLDGLMETAEAALKDTGAKIILSSFVTGEDWRSVFKRRSFEPLTLYLSRSDLGDQGIPVGIRLASEKDISGIVMRSAENRQVLFNIDAFWQAHPDADTRFSGWMTRSLTLRDRDMLVMGASENLDGYVIAQPASRLHFPPAHDIAGTGVIDDYYHFELVDPTKLTSGSEGATALLRAGEAALADRGMGAAFVVCPAGWQSKIEMLEAAGYETAMIWSIKR